MTSVSGTHTLLHSGRFDGISDSSKLVRCICDATGGRARARTSRPCDGARAGRGRAICRRVRYHLCTQKIYSYQYNEFVSGFCYCGYGTPALDRSVAVRYAIATTTTKPDGQHQVRYPG
jgi:hypothetical protein